MEISSTRKMETGKSLSKMARLATWASSLVNVYWIRQTAIEELHTCKHIYMKHILHTLTHEKKIQ